MLSLIESPTVFCKFITVTATQRFQKLIYLHLCLVKKAAFHHACSNLQHTLREIQNNWWIDLAERTQLCADTGDFRGFYDGLKKGYGPTIQVQSPLRSSDGQRLLTVAQW